MKICFRPFGVGVEDVDTAVLKEKGEQVVKEVKVHAGNALFISIGLGLLVAEVATRYATNGVQAVATELADLHDVIAVKQTVHEAQSSLRKGLARIAA